MSRMAFSVIRLKLGFAACGATSLTSAGHHRPKQKHVLHAQACFFVQHRPLQERALDGPLPHEKSATS